jgi:L-iditol 2-dehydrogenase
MKAVRLHSAHDLRVDELPAPSLRAGLALVRPRAVSVCGSDLHFYRQGGIGDNRAAQPLVLGHEFAGDVVAVSPGAPDGPDLPAAPAAAPGEPTPALRPGMAVAVDPAIPCEVCEHCLAGNPNLCPRIRFAGTPPTDGGLQELIAWPAHLLRPLPAGMSHEAGALLEPLGVGIHALDLAKIRLADTIAVLGCGTIGLIAAKLARLSGAVRVFATDLLPARLAAARDFANATDVFDASADDPVARIRELTGGRGVDVAIECAGADETPRQAVELVRPGGTVVLVGIPEDDRTEFPAGAARRKGVTIKLSRRMKHVYPRAMALAEAGLIDLPHLVSHRFRLAQTPQAFALLDAPEAGVVKAVIEL